MLESLLFMALMIIGVIALILSVVIIILGLGKKEKSLRMVGFGIGTIPVLCCGLFVYWCVIAIPSFNNNQMNDFAGIYFQTENNQFAKPIKLVLNPNGTYEFDTIQGIGLEKSGTWKTGGIDGHFNFYDESGNLSDVGMPAGSGENCSLSFQIRASQDEFFELESINFEKIK